MIKAAPEKARSELLHEAKPKNGKEVALSGWTDEKAAILVQAQDKCGSSWTKIAKLLLGRSELAALRAAEPKEPHFMSSEWPVPQGELNFFSRIST